MPPLGIPGPFGTEDCPGRTRANHLQADASLFHLSRWDLQADQPTLHAQRNGPKMHLHPPISPGRYPVPWASSPAQGRATQQSSKASWFISPTHMQTGCSCEHTAGGSRAGSKSRASWAEGVSSQGKLEGWERALPLTTAPCPQA